MTTDDARLRLGDLVAARRKELGLSKEAAARLANISSITWKRVEDGKPVQDAKYAKVSAALGWDAGAIEDYLAGGIEPDTTVPAADYVADAPDPVVEQMLETIRREHPDWLHQWAERLVAEQRDARSDAKRSHPRTG